ncbi:MAG: SpoIIE family protein phosphatase [Acidobacteriota bacterium]
MAGERPRSRSRRKAHVSIEGSGSLEQGLRYVKGLTEGGLGSLKIDAETLGISELDLFGWKPFKKKVPPPASERLAALILTGRREIDAFHIHLATYLPSCVFLLATNALTNLGRSDLPWVGRVWSLMAVSGWGLLVAIHGLVQLVVQAPHRDAQRRRLEEEMRAAPSPRESAAQDGLEALRTRLIQRAEEARAALRPLAPDAAATVSRGEVRALSVVAWLDAARRQVATAGATGEIRRSVAMKLSDPDQQERHGELRQMLARLDRREHLLASLEREVVDRRQRLESFMLALDSARMARPESMPAVSAPLTERVALLDELQVRPRLPAPDATGEAPEARSRRIEEEVRLAQELQRSILPERAPTVAGLDVAHIYRPCNEVGGDFYDFHTAGGSRLWIAIGDASGHGIDSSMVSSMCKSGLYLQATAGRSLPDAMAELNRMMCDTLGRRRIMTLALVEIDVERRLLRLVNAGQVFPLLLRGGVLTELELPGYPLGVRRDTTFAVIERQLEPGDSILLLTDGVIEALDADRRPYGWDRLFASLRKLESPAAFALVESAAADLARHLGNVAPQDDVTLVGVRFQP